MGNLIDLTGKRFGRLSVIERDPTETRHGKWLCVCDCGNSCSVYSTNLRRGTTVSCGCKKSERISILNKSHGMSKKRLYYEWTRMRSRCNNPENQDFSLYGGRGITVCPEWSDSFEAFRDWAISNGYRDDLTIDRKDNDGPYSPENCRWATQKEQQNNKRNNSYITFNGRTQTMKQWADEIGIDNATLWRRLKTGWSIERALTEPVHKEKRKKHKGE